MVTAAPALRAFARAAIYRAPGESETCPACRSPRLFELDLLTMRRQQRLVTGFVSACDECGLVFSNPLPTHDELQAMYTPEGDWGRPRRDRDEAPAAGSGRGRPGRSWSRMFDPVRDELSVLSPPAGARALDFGCGSGELLDRLQECGWTTAGIEPAVGSAFPRHERLDAVPATPSFDLIVAHHVLEHVADPLDLLRQFARACRPGGYLFIGVPRFDTLPVHRDYKYVINGHAHVTAYTWPCLQGLLARAGFTPVAPPPDRISKGSGRMTAARIRVMARRIQTAAGAEIERPASPAAAARAAMRAYRSAVPPRGLLNRLGLYRLSARRIERRRRRDILARKAHKRAV